MLSKPMDTCERVNLLKKKHEFLKKYPNARAQVSECLKEIY
jgi:hypothetical protein